MSWQKLSEVSLYVTVSEDVRNLFWKRPQQCSWYRALTYNSTGGVSDSDTSGDWPLGLDYPDVLVQLNADVIEKKERFFFFSLKGCISPAVSSKGQSWIQGYSTHPPTGGSAGGSMCECPWAKYWSLNYPWRHYHVSECMCAQRHHILVCSQLDDALVPPPHPPPLPQSPGWSETNKSLPSPCCMTPAYFDRLFLWQQTMLLLASCWVFLSYMTPCFPARVTN